MGLTKPRPRKAVSQATISKLSKAMGDPTKTFYGKSLGGRVPASTLGADRFLPANFVMSPNSKTGDGSHQPNPPYTTHEVYKDKTHVDSDRSKPLKVTSFGLRVLKAMNDLHNSGGNNPKAQAVIDQAEYDLIQAPQIKAQEEELARQIKVQEEQKAQAEKERSETIAFLKMRVMELSTAPAISISTERSWSKFAILGIAIVGFIIILRRRA